MTDLEWAIVAGAAIGFFANMVYVLAILLWL